MLTTSDSHGQPALVAIHGACAARTIPVDTFDWGFCWRSFDALRACALSGADCPFALGNTPQNRAIGTWSDGVPVIGLKVASVAPVRALPVPARQTAAPSGRSRRPPTATVDAVPLAGRHAARITVHGTAAGANGVAFVELAVVRRTHGQCVGLTPAGAFATLARCTAPMTGLFAAGTTRWSLTLPARLPRGAYRVLVRAVDGFGQTPRTWSGRTLVVT